MTTTLFIDILGWIGGALILGAYILLTAGKVDAKSARYQGMNFVGALGFIANGYYYGALPSAALNVIWAGIAIFALSRILGRKPASPE